MLAPYPGPEGSFLSQGIHGYDFVVAATEFGINDAVKRHLVSSQADTTAPTMELLSYTETVVVGGVAENIDIVMTMDEFYDHLTLGNTPHFNPFDFADNATHATEPNLSQMNFHDPVAGVYLTFEGGFRARLGIPGADEATDLEEFLDDVPDMLMLNAINDIKLNLLCAEFQIIEFQPGPSSLTYLDKMRNLEQSADDPWVFTTSVNIDFDQANFTDLPQEVKDQMQIISGESFSIQQLLFDVTQSAISDRPSLPDPIDSDLKVKIETQFLGRYWDIFLKNGGPVLGYAGKADPDAEWEGSMKMTDYKLSVSQYHDPATGKIVQTPDKRRFNTLNYLCMASDETFPTINTMEWNYANASADPAKGVVATNREVFAAMARDALATHASSNCYKPVPWLDTTGWGEEQEAQYRVDFTEMADPVVTEPEGTTTILEFAHESVEDLSVKHFVGVFPQARVTTTLTYRYDMKVFVEGSELTVNQTIVVVGKYHAEKIVTGNLIFDETATHIDRETITVFTLTVDETGSIDSTVSGGETITHAEQDSVSPSGFQDYYSDMNNFSQDISEKAQEVVNKHLEFKPEAFLSSLKAFVLPAGKSTFSYTDVKFSDNGDLLATWSYR